MDFFFFCLFACSSVGFVVMNVSGPCNTGPSGIIQHEFATRCLGCYKCSGSQARCRGMRTEYCRGIRVIKCCYARKNSFFCFCLYKISVRFLTLTCFHPSKHDESKLILYKRKEKNFCSAIVDIMDVFRLELTPSAIAPAV